jgi:hypothetical protein
VQLFHVVRLEWDSPVQHGKEYDSRGPEVDTEGVALVLEDLWGDVGRGTTLLGHAKLTFLALLRNTKVTYLDIALAIEQDVVKFDISMGNVLGMDVAETVNYLLENDFRIRLLQSASLSDVIKKITASAKLHHDDDVLLGFDGLIDFYYMVVSQFQK